MAGLTIAGIVELLDVIDVPVHVQESEVEWVTRSTGVGADALVGTVRATRCAPATWP